MRERGIICLRITNKEGFTLIEMIVSIVLLAIISTMAGLGVIYIARGYVNTNQNAVTAQEAQIAMARIVKELGLAISIASTPAPTSTSVSYTRWKNDSDQLVADEVTNTITFSNNTVSINYNSTGNQTLINNVTAFTLAYYCYNNNGVLTSTCTYGSGGNIGRVDVAFTVSGVIFNGTIRLNTTNMGTY